MLEQSKVKFAIYDGVFTEPTGDFVQEGRKTYRDNGGDFVIGLGGGAPIDTAKVIAVMVTNPGSIEDYMGLGRIVKKGVPLVAIPTAAGTGSEVSIFTIITDTKKTSRCLSAVHSLCPR
jgi:alcohol dehydrogenase class IV